jgi:nucleotide-binding universal stress UspA family protein
MRTLLIPVDFSETSSNAVEYAAGFCKQFEYQRIILLKSFYDTMFDEVVMSAQYGGVGTDFRSQEHEEAETRVKQWAKELSLKNREIEVVAITSELPLMRAIAQVIHEEKPRAILLGSDNNAYDNDSYVSGHVIRIAKASPINVIIIPAGQAFQPIEEALIPVDTFSKASLARIEEIGDRPFLRKIKLDILKFDSAQMKDNDQQLAETEELHDVLGSIRHQVFFSAEKKTIDAVMSFLKQHPVQLIIALPGKYSFLYRLTHQLISEAICRNTEKPVLIVKQFL